MAFHSILVLGAQRDQVHTVLTDFMLENGCQMVAQNAPPTGEISFALWPEENRVCLQSSDPLLRQCNLFPSPNDFFLPLSEKLPLNPIMVIDVDDDDVLQYWIFEAGSCAAQFHGKWEEAPAEEMDCIRGNPETMGRICGIEVDHCKTWLESDRKLEGLSRLMNLTTSQQAPGSALLTVLRFRLPDECAESARPQKRLFPWILMAAPTVYFSLRYNAEPDLRPVAHTPSGNPCLDEEHCLLLEKDFEFHGDYMINIMPQAETFARLYYRPRDCTHAGITRFATTQDAEWQTEITTQFTDGIRLSTVRSNSPSPFSVSKRVIFWDDESVDLSSLLSLHEKRVVDQAEGREIRRSTDFLEDVRASIRDDYRELAASGILRRRKNSIYGLTWRGAFKMLYEHWRASRDREKAAE